MDITAKVKSYHGGGVHIVERYASQTPGVYYPTGQRLSVTSSEELTIGAFYDMRLSENPEPVDHKVYGAIQRNL